MSAHTIPDVDFKSNTNQRTPCVLILDGSGSMEGVAINALNEGLQQLDKDLKKDSVARERVRFLLMKVGGQDEVVVVNDWVDAIDFAPPTVDANGTTPLGAALDKALFMIQEEKGRMDNAGIPSTRPLIYLITDGEPTDSGWPAAAARCKAAIQAKKLQLFAIGTDDAVDFQKLEMTGGVLLKLRGLNFKELFQFLSRSVSSASQAAPGQNTQVTLGPNITAVSVPS